MISQYKLVKASQVEDFTRPFQWLFPPEADKNISLGDIKTLRSHALVLYKNCGPLRTAIQDKCMYSIGRHWQPKYLGDDSAFGEKATTWLRDNFYPVCNLMGEEFGLVETMSLMSIHLDVWGECFIYLTEYPDSGFPAIQIVPCYRVDQPRQNGALDEKGVLTGNSFGGAYKGLKVESGVVKNPQGRAIAFHVLGNDVALDAIVSADNMIRVREIDMGDETRATPSLSHGINQGRSVMSLISNEQEFLEAASRIALIENNELGGVDIQDPQNALAIRPAPPGLAGTSEDPGFQPTTPPQYAEEWNQSAQTRYYKAKSGGSVQAFQFTRPANEWDRFISRLIRFVVDPIWPVMLLDKESEIGAAMARAVVARANRLTQARQALLLRPARRILQYAVAKGSKIGRISQSDQWYNWGVTYPARITTDFGRDGKMEILEVQEGVRLPSEIVEERGMGNYTDFLQKRYRDAANDILIRAQVEKELGVDLSAITQPVIAGSGSADVTD